MVALAVAQELQVQPPELWDRETLQAFRHRKAIMAGRLHLQIPLAQAGAAVVRLLLAAMALQARS